MKKRRRSLISSLLNCLYSRRVVLSFFAFWQINSYNKVFIKSFIKWILQLSILIKSQKLLKTGPSMILLIKNFLQSGVKCMTIFVLIFYQGKNEKLLRKVRFWRSGKISLLFFSRKIFSFGRLWILSGRLTKILSREKPGNKMKEQIRCLSLEKGLKKLDSIFQISFLQMMKVKKRNLHKT